MLTQQLLILIDETNTHGIPKTVLRAAHKIRHGPVGDGEFEDALRTLVKGKFAKTKIHALTKDTHYVITAAGEKALGS